MPLALQIKYIEKVISKAKRGYLTMNSGMTNSVYQGRLSLNQLLENIPNLKVFPEKPLTANGNYIVCWGQDTEANL